MKLLQASSVAPGWDGVVLRRLRLSADCGLWLQRRLRNQRQSRVLLVAPQLQRGASAAASGGGYGGYYGWGCGGTWSRDYPKADRQVLLALKRLTRIQTRSTEQVVNLDSDEIFNYPWVYAVQVQTWSFTDEEAKRLRDYLLKGGFLMVDDFHGTEDWEDFMDGMRQVFPDRPSRRSRGRR